jgi:hypothetical protein
MEFRQYNSKKDNKAAHQIWREIGWIESGKENIMDLFLEYNAAWVAELESSPECLVTSCMGDMQYLDKSISFNCITAVTTSLIARKQGLAGRLTAHAISQEAQKGSLVSALGIFDQGYYDKLGFGTGPYEHIISFDPSTLRIDRKPKVPTRLTEKDIDKIHESRKNRLKHHGSCTAPSPNSTLSEIKWAETAFGLGYFNEAGELTHHLWMNSKNVEVGPFNILWMAYQNMDQLLDLLALIKSLGDQIRVISMVEPTGIQFQDFLQRPFHHQMTTKKSDFQQSNRAIAYWQMRMNDIPKCMDVTHLQCSPFSFNLKIHDPIESYLDRDNSWNGVGGSYVISLGKKSSANQGLDETLPTLNTSVGAFTRLWLGANSATSLSVSDDMSGPDELLTKLDWAFRLPIPKPDWQF